MAFTRDELNEMYKSQLVALAGYNGIKLNMKMLKGEMVDKILEFEVVEAELPPMSVRVRRIYESQKE